MAAVASVSLYLAFSLAAGAQGAETPSTVAAPAVTQPARSATRPHNYVIVDLPHFDRGRAGKSIETVIAEAALEPATKNNFDPLAARDTAADINYAVVTEHDARVAALKQRIASLKADPGSDHAAQVRDLGVRLKRAEAARGLALARATLSNPCTEGCDAKLALTGTEPSPAPTATSGTRTHMDSRAAAAAPSRPKPHTLTTIRRARMPSAFVTTRRPFVRPRFHAPQTFAAAPRYLRRYPHAAAAHHLAVTARLVLRPRGAVRVTASTAGHLGVRTARDRLTAETLKQSRRLLSQARAALTNPAPSAPVEIAGLWTFEGSAKWSLEAFRHRGA